MPRADGPLPLRRLPRRAHLRAPAQVLVRRQHWPVVPLPLQLGRPPPLHPEVRQARGAAVLGEPAGVHAGQLRHLHADGEQRQRGHGVPAGGAAHHPALQLRRECAAPVPPGCRLLLRHRARARGPDRVHRRAAGAHHDARAEPAHHAGRHRPRRRLRRQGRQRLGRLLRRDPGRARQLDQLDLLPVHGELHARPRRARRGARDVRRHRRHRVRHQRRERHRAARLLAHAGRV
mmetsp:Transcript_25825/g.79688  ORF Transcript_25825/g.79688 Transcript_25825/m.79688 type:complete len:233 (+) Transcript_25825:1999-2697(+)